MAPDPRTEEEHGPSGPIITGHKISLNVHYDQSDNNSKGLSKRLRLYLLKERIISDSSKAKGNGNLTPIEQKVANTGALQMAFQQEKFTHVDNVVKSVSKISNMSYLLKVCL